MRLAGSSGLCCFHEKMTSQGPWLDFFFSKMDKNSTRKVALPLASVPHTGKKNAASYHGLLGTPCLAPVFSSSIAWIRIACNRAIHTHWCFYLPVARPQEFGVAEWCWTLHDGGIRERPLLEQAARSHQWKVLCAVGSSARPSGKCLGMLQNNGSIFPPVQLPPAASHRNQLMHSMESASLPTHKSPCPRTFPKAPHRGLRRERTMVFQIKGLAPVQ